MGDVQEGCRPRQPDRRQLGNWTTRGYANSRIANSRSGHLADWSTRRLVIPRFFGYNGPWVATRYCRDRSVVRWSWTRLHRCRGGHSSRQW